MKKNKKTKTTGNIEIQTFCRYTYRIIPEMSIKECLMRNDWLYNQSFNFFTYIQPGQQFPEGVISMEKMWCTKEYILFSGMNTTLQDYLEILDWDLFGTWYIFLFPKPVFDEVTRFPGVNSFLPRISGYTIDEYYDADKDWQFIHQAAPDIFISRQPEGIMFGALSELNLFSIETK